MQISVIRTGLKTKLFSVQKYMKGLTVCARTCMYLVRSTLPRLYWSQQREDLEVHSGSFTLCSKSTFPAGVREDGR